MLKAPFDPVQLAIPFFVLAIILEILVGRFGKAKANYETRDTAVSLAMGFGSTVAGVLFAGVIFAATVWVWNHRIFTIPMTAVWAWVAIFLLEDLTYYWFHRISHERRFWWASHVNHHTSTHYNLSTALRQTWTGGVAGTWLLWLPLSFIGFPPAMVAIQKGISLVYQFWIHTEAIKRMPRWFEAVFNTPSHHRVHHARNARYLDANYAGILIVWDRLFGSYQPELAGHPCHYGTRSPLRSWNPVWANLEVYAALWHDCRHAARWGDKLRVWVKPPGWRPRDVALRFPKPPFVPGGGARYAPALTPARRNAATTAFIAAIGATCVVLWNAHRMAPLQLAGSSALVLALLWLVGWISERGEPVQATVPAA